MYRVLIGGRPAILEDKDTLGVGGEATVFAWNGQAAKIYLQPSVDRGEKLLQFPKNLPASIIAPQELIRDSRNSAVIGFTMTALDNSYTKLSKLSIKSYRQTSGTTLKDIALLFDDSLRTLSELHHRNVIVGDLNKLGLFFKDNCMYYIDADSFQFDKWPCVAYTVDYLDPLVDVNKLNYSNESDLYAFLVLFLQSSIMVHPYGGSHASLPSKERRAAQGVTVFDPSVIYPQSIALSPYLLTDELLDVYEAWYAKKMRGPLNKNIFSDYASSLTICNNCQAYYPKQRGRCPICSTVVPVTTVQLPNVKCLIQVDGSIVWYSVGANIIKAMAVDDLGVSLYTEHSKRLVSNSEPNLTYSMVNSEPVSCDGNGNLKAYNKTIKVDLFDGDPVYGTNDKYLYCLSGGSVLRLSENEYEEKIIKTALRNQTFFVVDPNRDRLFGFIRSGSMYSYWIAINRLNYDVELTELEAGEVLIETHAKFASSSILVLRKTQFKGRERIRLDEISEKGDLLSDRKVSWPDLDLDSVAYTLHNVFRSTDQGAVRFDTRTATEVTFKNTTDIVMSGDKLSLYKNGIAVIKNNRILYIE